MLINTVLATVLYLVMGGATGGLAAPSISMVQFFSESRETVTAWARQCGMSESDLSVSELAPVFGLWNGEMLREMARGSSHSPVQSMLRQRPLTSLLCDFEAVFQRCPAESAAQIQADYLAFVKGWHHHVEAPYLRNVLANDGKSVLAEVPAAFTERARSLLQPLLSDAFWSAKDLDFRRAVGRVTRGFRLQGEAARMELAPYVLTQLDSLQRELVRETLYFREALLRHARRLTRESGLGEWIVWEAVLAKAIIAGDASLLPQVWPVLQANMGDMLRDAAAPLVGAEAFVCRLVKVKLPLPTFLIALNRMARMRCDAGLLLPDFGDFDQRAWLNEEHSAHNNQRTLQIIHQASDLVDDIIEMLKQKELEAEQARLKRQKKNRSRKKNKSKKAKGADEISPSLGDAEEGIHESDEDSDESRPAVEQPSREPAPRLVKRSEIAEAPPRAGKPSDFVAAQQQPNAKRVHPALLTTAVPRQPGFLASKAHAKENAVPGDARKGPTRNRGQSMRGQRPVRPLYRRAGTDDQIKRRLESAVVEGPERPQRLTRQQMEEADAILLFRQLQRHNEEKRAALWDRSASAERSVSKERSLSAERSIVFDDDDDDDNDNDGVFHMDDEDQYLKAVAEDTVKEKSSSGTAATLSAREYPVPIMPGRNTGALFNFARTLSSASLASTNSRHSTWGYGTSPESPMSLTFGRRDIYRQRSHATQTFSTATTPSLCSSSAQSTPADHMSRSLAEQAPAYFGFQAKLAHPQSMSPLWTSMPLLRPLANIHQAERAQRDAETAADAVAEETPVALESTSAETPKGVGALDDSTSSLTLRAPCVDGRAPETAQQSPSIASLAANRARVRAGKQREAVHAVPRLMAQHTRRGQPGKQQLFQWHVTSRAQEPNANVLHATMEDSSGRIVSL